MRTNIQSEQSKNPSSIRNGIFKIQELFHFLDFEGKNLYIDHRTIVSVGSHIGDSIDHVHAFVGLTEHGMVTIEMVGGLCLDYEELASVAIRSGIRHGQGSLDVRQTWSELVLERLSVYTLSSHSSRGRVSSLDHEILDYTVEDGSVVVAFFRKCDEIRAGFGSFLHKELYFYGSESSFEEGDSIACYWCIGL